MGPKDHWRDRECRRLSDARPYRPTLDRRDPTRRGCSKVRAAAREKEEEGHPRARERRIGLMKIEGGCELWPGQPGRSDPTHAEIECLQQQLEKQRDSRGRKSGPGPKSSIIRWRAPVTTGRTTCAQDLRKRRRAWDRRQRRALFGGTSWREDASLRRTTARRATSTLCKPPLGQPLISSGRAGASQPFVS